jgi:acyl carrier protein
METQLLEILNHMLDSKGNNPIDELDPTLKLRENLGFDSFDLAELTVRIESKYGVDIFADGLIDTIAEIQAKIENR